MKNRLYYGDNEEILASLASKEPESVDLMYLDPPFNSKANYNILYKDEQGKSIQNEAFQDTWQWTTKSQELYTELQDEHPYQEDFLKGLFLVLGKCGMFNYLLYMMKRLLLMQRLLKPTGSIYLHCDPTASHYLKLVMDNVFGKKYFRNEVIWSYQRWTGATKHFQRMHDIVLFYSKSEASTFNTLKEAYSLKSKHKGARVTKHVDNKIVQNYTSDSSRQKSMRDVWEISYLNSQAKERLGYPTQKPLALLERIIKASSNEGDVVLDPFCGCGTSVSAAEKLERKWIGIDISYLSVNLIKNRLKKEYKVEESAYEVSGVPTDIQGAEDLLRRTIGRYVGREPKTLEEALALAESEDLNAKHKRNAGRFEFQRWVCGLINALPNDKEIKDRGIDGRLKWLDIDTQHPKQKVRELWGAVEIKSSKYATPVHVRALKGVISNGGHFTAGIIITLYKTDTKEIREICAGFKNPIWRYYTGVEYPKLQVFSVEEYFKGKKPNLPDAVIPYKLAEFKGKNKQVCKRL